jgi:hypothetical protein
MTGGPVVLGNRAFEVLIVGIDASVRDIDNFLRRAGGDMERDKGVPVSLVFTRLDGRGESSAMLAVFEKDRRWMKDCKRRV